MSQISQENSKKGQTHIEPVSLEGAYQDAAVRCYLTTELFQGKQEVCIKHAGESYRLRITKNGKLILTK